MAKAATVGRDVLTARVRVMLALSSDREADRVVRIVLDAIADIMKMNIETNGFTLKLPKFGKFVVRHTKSKKKVMPLLGGKIMMTRPRRKLKFFPLEELRSLEIAARED